MLNSLMKAVYKAREGPGQGALSIAEHHQIPLNRLRPRCQTMQHASHMKTQPLAVEFLNDWDAISRVLEHPVWPLTNNEAEPALRHWVILRRITQGTRSEQGSRSLGLIASVIETCRLRATSPLLYIRDVISARRQGEEVPPLPLIPQPAYPT
ncbi:MAG: transposase [Pseudomonadota bacterium]